MYAGAQRPSERDRCAVGRPAGGLEDRAAAHRRALCAVVRAAAATAAGAAAASTTAADVARSSAPAVAPGAIPRCRRRRSRLRRVPPRRRSRRRCRVLPGYRLRCRRFHSLRCRRRYRPGRRGCLLQTDLPRRPAALRLHPRPRRLRWASPSLPRLRRRGDQERVGEARPFADAGCAAALTNAATAAVVDEMSSGFPAESPASSAEAPSPRPPCARRHGGRSDTFAAGGSDGFCSDQADHAFGRAVQVVQPGA